MKDKLKPFNYRKHFEIGDKMSGVDAHQLQTTKTESPTAAMLDGPVADGTESVEFDRVLEALTTRIGYQIMQIVIISSFVLPYAMAVLSFVFTGYEPPHVCAETNETDLLSQYSIVNDTTAKVVYETCRIRITSNKTGHAEDLVSIGCVNGHSYEGGKFVSMKTEWDLVCERQGLAELVQTMYNVGMIVGAVFLSSVPDRFGRKYILIICGAISALFEFGLFFSPSIYVAIALKFFSGIVTQCFGFCPYVMASELLPAKKRQKYVMINCALWPTWLMVLGLTAYLLRAFSWRVLQLTVTLVNVIPLTSCYFLNESLPWLFAKGKHIQALNLIKKICKLNSIEFREAEQAYRQCISRFERLEQREEDSPGISQTAVAKYGPIDILRHRRLLTITLVLGLTWFTHNLTYSGLYLTSATLPINRFFVFMIMAGIEIFEAVIFSILLVTMGRRTIILIFLSLTGICLFLSACLAAFSSPESRHIRNSTAAFFFLGKMTLCLSFSSLYAFTEDLFPTTIRSIGLGFCAFNSRAGGVVAPYLFPLFRIAKWAPGTLLTALCLITVGIYPLVPETKGRELPTTVEAVEDLPRGRTRRTQRNKSPAIVT